MTESSRRTRVVVVDDQELVRSGFSMILGAEPDLHVVGEASNGREAVAVCRELSADVALMDVRMPVLDGVEATRLVTASPTDAGTMTRVLILTTFDLDEYVYQAIRAGASGFLLKDAPRSELVHAVRAVAAGDTLLAPAITRRLIEDFVRRPPPGAMPERLSSLTARELDVLRLVARGLNNAQIGDHLFVAETTAKTHVNHIMVKLELRDRIHAVVLAYESGLVRPGEVTS